MSIVDAISKHVKLTKFPNGKHRGICPFCGGALFVYPEEPGWHCFGCNVGGDEIAFVTLVNNRKEDKMGKITVGRFLSSPCTFCGYNGEGYWQKGTHSKECLFYNIGGADKRAALIEGLDLLIETRETSKAYKNMMAEIDKDES